MRVVVFLLLLFSLLPRPTRAQLWHYPDPCAAAYERWNWDNWGKSPAIQAPKPTCYLRPMIPRYDVSPDSVQLVLRCQNHLRLPKRLNGLRFTAEEATVKVDPTQHELLLIPATSTVTLRAWLDNKELFVHQLQTIAAPAPEVKFLAASCEANVCKPGPRLMGIQNLSIRAIPEQAFANAMPEDARFRVNKFEVALLRNGSVVGVPLVVNGPDVNLQELLTQRQAGDLLQIEVKQVLRMNFQGQIEEMPLPERRVYAFHQTGACVGIRRVN